MKIMKFVKAIGNVGAIGEAVLGFGSKAMDMADRIIHREEYERARKRALVWKIVLGVAAGVLVVLLFPYKIIVEKNGDFEVRTLLLRVFRKTDSDVDGLDAPSVEEVFDECDVIEAVDEE